MGGKLIKYPFYSLVLTLFSLGVVLPVLYTFLFLDRSFFDLFFSLKRPMLFLLLKSISIAAAVGVFATFFGTVLGFLLYRTDLLHQKFLKLVLLIPLFVPPYIMAVSWKDTFYLFFKSAAFLNSGWGLIMLLTLIFTPLAMLITGSAFSSINAYLEEAGFLMAGRKRVFVRLVLPLVKPALFTSFVLIFIFSISEFTVPTYLGVRTFTTEIFTRFSAFYDHSLATVQSLILIVICMLLLFADRKYISEAPFLAFGGRGNAVKVYKLHKNRMYIFFVWSWVVLTVIWPLIVLFLTAFQNGTSDFVKAFISLKSAFINSVSLSLFGAFLTVIIGITSAFGQVKRSQKFFDALLLFVFAVPAIILGISLIKFYNKPVFNMIYSGFAIVIIGYVGKFSFIAAKLIGNALRQIPDSLEESARLSGAGQVTVFWRILFPVIRPAVLSAFLINFIFIINEVGVTIMVYPPGTELLPIKVFTMMANASRAFTSSMTLIVLLFILLLISGLYFTFSSIIKSNRYASYRT